MSSASNGSGGSGIQSDLKVFAALRCTGTSAVTSIAFRSHEVDVVQSIQPDVLEGQLNALFEEHRPKAIKIGSLGSEETVNAVVGVLAKNFTLNEHPPLIFSWVTSASDDENRLAVERVCKKLLPWINILSLDIQQAARLAHVTKDSRERDEMVIEYSRKLSRLGPRYIYLQNGDSEAPSTTRSDTTEKVVGMLYDSGSDSANMLKQKRMAYSVDSRDDRHAAATCAYLATGLSVPQAIEKANDFIHSGVSFDDSPADQTHIKRILPVPSLSSPYPFTDYLIARTDALWEKYVGHPFTIQLGNGTLPMSAFLYFVKQGYHYCLSYARAAALGAYKAKDFTDMSGSMTIVQSCLDEIPANIKFCASHGIGRAELEATNESVVNIAYSRYMLDVASTGDMLDLRVATAPCLIGYGVFGSRLLERSDDEVDRSERNPYYTWALNYAKEEFQHSVTVGRDLLEQMLADCPPSQSRLDELVKIFTQSTELEVAFWDDAMTAGKQPVDGPSVMKEDKEAQ